MQEPVKKGRRGKARYVVQLSEPQAQSPLPGEVGGKKKVRQETRREKEEVKGRMKKN